MLNKTNYYFFFLLILFCSDCRSNQDEHFEKKNEDETPSTNDTTIRESFNYLNEKGKLINDYISEMEMNTKWTKIDTLEYWESVEGGKAMYYFNKDKICLIVTEQFGEMTQVKSKYYLLNNKLVAFNEKVLRYNRPIYYDSITMKLNQDSVYFDITKSIINEETYFFNDDNMLSINVLQEGNRTKEEIIRNFKNLIQLPKNQ
jgi:hypothetical protein